ncbi:MAG: anti-sigma factor family protein [Myxococcaceae bacterium]
MKCDEFDQLCLPYLDNELDAAATLPLEAHLSACAACASKLHEQETLRALVRAHLKSSAPVAPDSVRQSVQATFRREDRRAAGLRMLRWGSAGVALTLVWVTVSQLRPRTDDRLSEQAVLRHSRRLPFEVQSVSGETVEQWFDGKLQRRIRVPELQNATLSGARLSHVSDRDAAYIAYEIRSAPSAVPRQVGVFVLENDGELDSLPIEPAQARVTRTRGFNVAMWRSGGVAYQLVTDLEEPEIRRLLTPTPHGPLPLSVTPAGLGR